MHLVVHVEGADHFEVHVDELSGEVEVALYVAGVDDVDDDVGCVVDDLPSDVHFFGAVGCEGVSAGEVDDIEVVAFEMSFAFFGVDGYA